MTQKKIHVANKEEPKPGYTKSKTTSKTKNRKVNLIIQLRGGSEEDVLKVRVPANMNIGDIKRYLEERYSQNGDLFLSTLQRNVNSRNTRSSNQSTGQNSIAEKVQIIFKNSIGSDSEESRLRVPKGIKIQNLKDALASKFGLSPDDFNLIHVKS